MRFLRLFCLALSVLAAALIAGFFYAYHCSVMPGLAATNAVSAIKAMQGINAVARNAVFAVSFFGTLAFGGIATLLLIGAGGWPLALALLGTAIYGLGRIHGDAALQRAVERRSRKRCTDHGERRRNLAGLSRTLDVLECAAHGHVRADAGGIHGKPRYIDRTSAERSRRSVIAHAARSTFVATVESAFSR
jgi:hypothetical protein